MSYKFGSDNSTGQRIGITRTCADSNMSDSTTYYFWEQGFSPLTNNQTLAYIPSNGTINKVYAKFYVGTTGSNENCTLYIYLNDSSTTNLSTTIQLNTTTVTFSTTSLGLSVNAGDYIRFGFDTPAWVTNPLTVSATITALVE